MFCMLTVFFISYIKASELFNKQSILGPQILLCRSDLGHISTKFIMYPEITWPLLKYRWRSI